MCYNLYTQLVRFFSNKESTLRSIVDGMEIRSIHFWMIKNVVNSSRSGYVIFLRYLRNTDPITWHYVRWDNPVVRLFESHYFSIKLLLFFRRLKSKIMREWNVMTEKDVGKSVI